MSGSSGFGSLAGQTRSAERFVVLMTGLTDVKAATICVLFWPNVFFLFFFVFFLECRAKREQIFNERLSMARLPTC